MLGKDAAAMDGLCTYVLYMYTYMFALRCSDQKFAAYYGVVMLVGSSTCSCWLDSACVCSWPSMTK